MFKQRSNHSKNVCRKFHINADFPHFLFWFVGNREVKFKSLAHIGFRETNIELFKPSLNHVQRIATCSSNDQIIQRMHVGNFILMQTSLIALLLICNGFVGNREVKFKSLAHIGFRETNIQTFVKSCKGFRETKNRSSINSPLSYTLKLCTNPTPTKTNCKKKEGNQANAGIKVQKAKAGLKVQKAKELLSQTPSCTYSHLALSGSIKTLDRKHSIDLTKRTTV